MFDPFNIYKRQIHSSHSGQILRKKIRRKSGKAYTNEELLSAIPPLRALGYNVIKGPIYQTQRTSWVDTYIIPTGTVTFSTQTPQPFLFSSIWPDIKPDFSLPLSIDPLSVVNILFEIDLLSINLYGTYNSNYDQFPDIRVYMNNPNLPIIPDAPYDSILQPTPNFGLSYRAFNDSQIFVTESCTLSDTTLWGKSLLITKTESTDNNYLNIIERRQPAIITALRNDDYSVFNPALFYMYMAGSLALPATVSNSFITFQVKMIVEHK